MRHKFGCAVVDGNGWHETKASKICSQRGPSLLFGKHIRRRGLRPLGEAGHRPVFPYNECTYDDLDRLTDVEYHDSDSEAYVMDLPGNRTGDQTLRNEGQVNFTVESLTNRYTDIGASQILHDEAGNLTLDKDGYEYSYDYENRVVKIKDSSNNAVAEYAYDALPADAHDRFGRLDHDALLLQPRLAVSGRV